MADLRPLVVVRPDNEIMIAASAALGRSHAERGFEPYWQAIFPQRQAAYIRAYNERKAELAAPLSAFNNGGK